MDEAAVLPPFDVTPAAIDQLETLGGCVLIDVDDGGCCGSTYVFRALEDPDGSPAGAVRYGCPGAWLVVTSKAADVLPGARLDYAGRLKPPRFRVVRNPNTPNVCSCRRSFGEPWPGPGQPTCRSYQPMPWDEDYEPPVAWKRQTGYRSASRS